MGGPSAENEISLRSGHEVLENLDREKYSARAVVVDSGKRFFCRDIDNAVPSLADLSSPGKDTGFTGPFSPFSSAAIWDACDAAFLAFHGSFGEDGIFQGYLETIGIPYTGSGVYSSAVAMNKIASKMIFEQQSIPTPAYSIFRKNGDSIDAIARKQGFPCFVKCPQSGSSRLMGRATDRASLQNLLDEFTLQADEILIESAVTGPEFSCPVLEYPSGKTEALPPIEIRPKTSSFFDFEAKYTASACEEIVPAPQSPQVISRIQEIALKAHVSLGCSGLTRTDMILNGNAFYVLEINTLPGLTENSLAPKSFKSLGRPYSELIDILISSARTGKR